MGVARRFAVLCRSRLAGVLFGTAPAQAGGTGGDPARFCDDHFFEWTTFDGRVIEASWVPMGSLATSGSTTIGFSIESRGGCISTVAAGLRDGVVASDAFSLPATTAQCAYLEETFGLSIPNTSLRTFRRTQPHRGAASCYVNFSRSCLPPAAWPATVGPLRSTTPYTPVNKVRQPLVKRRDEMTALRLGAALALTVGAMSVGAISAAADPAEPNPAQFCTRLQQCRWVLR